MAKLADDFKSAVVAGGIVGGMRWINGTVSYRYTAIFAFEGDTLRNVCLVDKEDPHVVGCPDQPITESYCIYVKRTNESFSVQHALEDARVKGHPKQRSYQCYYGIPLVDSGGKLRGTVCHFDAEPTPVLGEVVSTLDDLAPYITEAVFGADRPAS